MSETLKNNSEKVVDGGESNEWDELKDVPFNQEQSKKELSPEELAKTEKMLEQLESMGANPDIVNNDAFKDIWGTKYGILALRRIAILITLRLKLGQNTMEAT